MANKHKILGAIAGLVGVAVIATGVYFAVPKIANKTWGEILQIGEEKPPAETSKLTLNLNGNLTFICADEKGIIYTEEELEQKDWQGETLTFILAPNDGYELLSTKINGEEIALDNNMFTVTIDKDTTIDVELQKQEEQEPFQPYSIVFNVDPAIEVTLDNGLTLDGILQINEKPIDESFQIIVKSMSLVYGEDKEIVINVDGREEFRDIYVPNQIYSYTIPYSAKSVGIFLTENSPADIVFHNPTISIVDSENQEIFFFEGNDFYIDLERLLHVDYSSLSVEYITGEAEILTSYGEAFLYNLRIEPKQVKIRWILWDETNSDYFSEITDENVQSMMSLGYTQVSANLSDITYNYGDGTLTFMITMANYL